MQQVYLISKADIANFESVGINVDENRVKVFVKKAQDFDIKPFMNAAFYFDFIKQFDPATGTFKTDAPQKYKDLFNGVEYTNREGHQIYFEGLKSALIYFAFARFVEGDAVHYTATGPVTKHRDDSDSLKLSDTIKIVQQHRSTANAAINDVIAYLDVKRTDFPLWRYNAKNTQARQPGPRIRAVDATDVRNRGYGDGYGHGYNNGLLNGLI